MPLIRLIGGPFDKRYVDVTEFIIKEGRLHLKLQPTLDELWSDEKPIMKIPIYVYKRVNKTMDFMIDTEI